MSNTEEWPENRLRDEVNRFIPDETEDETLVVFVDEDKVLNGFIITVQYISYPENVMRSFSFGVSEVELLQIYDVEELIKSRLKGFLNA